MYGLNLSVGTKPRFDFRRFIEWSDDMYDILTSDFMEKLEKLPQAGTFQVRTDRERLDNISYKIYGSTQYWWILAAYNYLPNHKYLRTGVKIRYFAESDLEKLLFSLKNQK